MEYAVGFGAVTSTVIRDPFRSDRVAFGGVLGHVVHDIIVHDPAIVGLYTQKQQEKTQKTC